MKGNPQVVQELCRILDCTDKQLYAKLYYKKIDPESITMADIDEIVGELRHKPSIVKWIKQHHPECELNDSTIRWRIKKMQEEGLCSLYEIPSREYENLYQSILNLEVRNYNFSSNKSLLTKGSMLNYLLEDVLPLSQALKRGIYNEDGTDGTLNVFKDPEFKPKAISRAEFFKLMRSRGYVLSADDLKA